MNHRSLKIRDREKLLACARFAPTSVRNPASLRETVLGMEATDQIGIRSRSKCDAYSPNFDRPKHRSTLENARVSAARTIKTIEF
jgi:hypothetical protein